MSNVIRGARGGAYSRWQLPNVGDDHHKTVQMADQGEPVEQELPTVEQIQEIQQQAYAEAYAQGYEAGIEAGKARMQEQVALVVSIFDKLARPLEELDEAVESEVVSLIVAATRQLVRRELKTTPGEVLAAVREALGILPVGQRDIRIYLHPEDAALVRESLTQPEMEGAWTIVEDPVLTRGGCRVETATSHVDARVESRLGAIISAVFGDERDVSAGG
ncbi:MAG: flagellar assembly protein FliH [Pseudomonadota bacterium]|nr:flagellar assembly protein FliH [Pseudomonadota bacterium]